MVVITKGAIHEFVLKHKKASISLNECFEKTKKANWNNFAAVKRTFNSTDAIGNGRYVFNIGGNNFRIIAMIHYSIRTVYIRAILTHKEYDVLNKMNNLNSL